MSHCIGRSPENPANGAPAPSPPPPGLCVTSVTGSPIFRPPSPPTVQPRHSCRREVSSVINFPLPVRPYDGWCPSFPDQGHGREFSTGRACAVAERVHSCSARGGALVPAISGKFLQSRNDSLPAARTPPRCWSGLLTQWKHRHALKGIFHSPRAKVMNGSLLGFEWAGLPSFTDPLGGAFRGRDLCRGPLQLESLHPLRSQDPRITRPPLHRIEKGSGADPGQN